MSEPPPETPKKSVLHACVIWVSWVLAAVGCYFLSVGPVVKLVVKESPSLTHGWSQAYNLYIEPCRWAYEHTLLQRPIGMYLHLWLPGLFDVKGDRTDSQPPPE
jgi:hypothetical protein